MAMDTSRLIPNNKELAEVYEPASIAHIGLNQKIKDRIANEGISADSPKVGSLIEDAHKELKASGFEMVDYVSDAHEGHEIDGFKARKGDRAGTRAAWQHPGTGQIKQFDADPDTMDISTLKNTSPDFLDNGSGASEELYEKGRTAARSGTQELSVERKAAQAAKQEENKKYQEQQNKIQQEECHPDAYYYLPTFCRVFFFRRFFFCSVLFFLTCLSLCILISISCVWNGIGKILFF